MKIIVVTFLHIFAIFFIGCSSASLPIPIGWSTFLTPAERIEYLENRTVTSEIQQKREQYIEKKHSEFTQIMNVLNNKLEELRNKADNNSNLTLWSGGLGVASGVAATTLVVASPANAIWVTGLSTFGTGVLTFQSRAALEGYSRDAVARVYNQIITKISQASILIGNDFEFLRQNVKSSGDDFDERAGELDKRIIELHSAAILTPLIVGIDQDIAELKRTNAEIKEMLDQAQKDINELKNTNPDRPSNP